MRKKTTFLFLFAAALIFSFFLKPLFITAASSGELPDVNNDGQVDYVDFVDLLNLFGTADFSGDFDKNLLIDVFDFNYLISFLIKPKETPTTHPQTSGVLAATGHAYVNSSTVDDATADAMVAEAVGETRTHYGNGEPKLVLVINNLAHWDQVISAVRQEFGNTPELVGTGTANPDYNSLTSEAFVGHASQSLAVLALGGSDISKVASLNTNLRVDGNLNYKGAGEALAAELSPLIDTTKKNLIILFGPGHYDDNVQTLLGFLSPLENAYGSPLPSSVKITSAASYITGGSLHEDNYKPTTLTAVLIQGDFQMAARGVGENFTSAGYLEDTRVLTQEVVNELGGPPDFAFLIPGHPPPDSSSDSNYNKMRDAFLGVVGEDTVVFGNEGGGETGHCGVEVSCGSDLKSASGTGGFAGTTDGSAVAGLKHFFITGIRGK